MSINIVIPAESTQIQPSEEMVKVLPLKKEVLPLPRWGYIQVTPNIYNSHYEYTLYFSVRKENNHISIISLLELSMAHICASTLTSL